MSATFVLMACWEPRRRVPPCGRLLLAAATLWRRPNRPNGRLGTATAGPTVWETAAGCRDMMEAAYLPQLRDSGKFPLSTATVLHGALAWHDALQEMLAVRPSDLNLILSRQTCRLLPELCPLDAPGGEPTWLDRVLPVYRSLHHIPRLPAPRQGEMSIAILYQDNRMLQEMAKAAARELGGSFVSVNLYPGRLVADPTTRLSHLHEIFFRHRAVLFLGHLHRPTPTHRGGWQLSEAPGA